MPVVVLADGVEPLRAAEKSSGHQARAGGCAVSGRGDVRFFRLVGRTATGGVGHGNGPNASAMADP